MRRKRFKKTRRILWRTRAIIKARAKKFWSKSRDETDDNTAWPLPTTPSRPVTTRTPSTTTLWTSQTMLQLYAAGLVGMLLQGMFGLVCGVQWTVAVQMIVRARACLHGFVHSDEFLRFQVVATHNRITSELWKLRQGDPLRVNLVKAILLFVALQRQSVRRRTRVNLARAGLFFVSSQSRDFFFRRNSRGRPRW